MAQRIAYLTLKGSAPPGGTHVADRLVSPEFVVDPVETLIAVTPVNPTDLLLSDVAYAEAAMRAERDGYDAAVIGALPDYGIEAARAAVDIPVVGSGQASLLTAAALGRRFSIVTIWPETMDFVYDRILRDNAGGDRCVSVRYVSTAEEQATLVDDDNFLTRMKAGREDMVHRILTEIEAARREGADSVVLGCNCMTPVAGVLAERGSLPIVDPAAAGYRLVESMLTMGVRPTRNPRVSRPDRHAMLTAMLQGDGDVAVGDEDCPVCVLGDDGTPTCDAV